MRSRSLVAALGVVLFVLMSACNALADTPDRVKADVLSDLSFVRTTLAGEPQHYGISQGTPHDQITLGEGFAAYRLSGSALLAGASGVQAVEPIPNEYVFPVLANGAPAGIIHVTQKGGKWTPYWLASDLSFATAAPAAKVQLKGKGLSNEPILIYDMRFGLQGLLGTASDGSMHFVPTSSNDLVGATMGQDMPFAQVADKAREVERQRAAYRGPATTGGLGAASPASAPTNTGTAIIIALVCAFGVVCVYTYRRLRAKTTDR